MGTSGDPKGHGDLSTLSPLGSCQVACHHAPFAFLERPATIPTCLHKTKLFSNVAQIASRRDFVVHPRVGRLRFLLAPSSSRVWAIGRFVAPEAAGEEDGEARVISRDSRLRSRTDPQPVRECERRRVPRGNGAVACWRCVLAAGMEHVDRPSTHHGVSRPLRLCQLARFVRSACWLRLQDAPCELGPAVGVRRGCGAARAGDRRLAVLYRHVLDVPGEFWMSWIFEILL